MDGKCNGDWLQAFEAILIQECAIEGIEVVYDLGEEVFSRMILHVQAYTMSPSGSVSIAA